MVGNQVPLQWDNIVTLALINFEELCAKIFFFKSHIKFLYLGPLIEAVLPKLSTFYQAVFLCLSIKQCKGYGRVPV